VAKKEKIGGIMKQRNVLLLLLLFIFSSLFASDLFEIEYDLDPYIFPTTGLWVYELTPRSLQITQDGGYAVLMELELTDGMLSHYCVALMKTDSEGNFQWFKFLSNDPELDDFEIVMQQFNFARGFTVSNDSGFAIPITNDMGYEYIGSYLLKLDSEGSFEWCTQLADEWGPFHYLQTIKQTSEDEYYAGGYKYYGYPSYLEIMEIAKFNAQGDTLWTKTYGINDSLSNYGYVKDIAIADDNNSVIVGDYYIVGTGRKAIALKINEIGEVIWIHNLEEPIILISGFDSIIKNNSNNQFKIIGSYRDQNNNLNVIIDAINSNGDSLLLWTMNAQYDSDWVPLSLVSNFSDFTVFTGRIGEDVEISCFDNYNNIVWQRELLGDVGDGAEVIQSTSDNYFVVIGKQDERLVITKMDTNGNSPAEENIIPQLANYLNVYPNPFNPTTTISFNMPYYLQTEIDIYNIKGQKIKNLIKDKLNRGNYQIVWKGNDNYTHKLSTGIYFIQLKIDNEIIQTSKVLLFK